MVFKPKILEIEQGRKLSWLGSLGIPYLFDGNHSFYIEQIDANANKSDEPILDFD